MWPILMQLLDLLPRLTKLLPSLERLLVGGAATAAVVDLTGVHTHLDDVGKSNAALLRQLQDQTIQIAGVEEEVKRLRMALEHSERRVERVETELTSLGVWVKLLGGASVVLLAALVILLVYVLHAK
jgi:hypothetical protein